MCIRLDVWLNSCSICVISNGFISNFVWTDFLCGYLTANFYKSKHSQKCQAVRGKTAIQLITIQEFCKFAVLDSIIELNRKHSNCIDFLILSEIWRILSNVNDRIDFPSIFEKTSPAQNSLLGTLTTYEIIIFKDQL